METSITLSARDVKQFAKKLAALNAVAARFRAAVGGGAANEPATDAPRRRGRRRVGRPVSTGNGRRRGRKARTVVANEAVPVNMSTTETDE